MILNLLHKNDGTLEITVEGASYGAKRTFGWYSDAISVLRSNYGANYQYSYPGDPSASVTKVEIWECHKTGINVAKFKTNETTKTCNFTQSHTREWCGNENCRES